MSQTHAGAGERKPETRVIAFWLLLLITTSVGVDAGERGKTPDRTTSAISRVATAFEESRSNADPRTTFVSRRAGRAILLTPDGAVFALRNGRSRVRMQLRGADRSADGIANRRRRR